MTILDSRPVFKRLGHVLLVIALLAATGSHWALLQTVAWTNMLADNLHTSSLTQALQRTFDGKHPCQLCNQIVEGKKSEKKTEFPTLAKKLEFISQRPAFVFSSPQDFQLLPVFEFSAGGFTHKPAVPPPRSLSA